MKTPVFLDNPNKILTKIKYTDSKAVLWLATSRSNQKIMKKQFEINYKKYS